MNQETKVIYKQLQLAGLGGVIAIVGLFRSRMDVFGIGLAIALFGIIRTWFIWRIIKQAED